MIRHIFTIIWNERKTNGWILLEYILVFCILWFCVDYLYFMVKSYREPLGFDIEHVYRIQMGKKNTDKADDEKRDDYEDALLFMNRVSQYPGVESICLAQQGVPYAGGYSSQNLFFSPDSLNENLQIRYVTSGFFDVFKIKLKSGRIFNWEDQAESKNILISPDRANKFGKYPGATYDISQIRTISDKKHDYHVVGITDKVKDTFFYPYRSSIFYPLSREQTKLHWLQIAICITPQADKDFVQRFTKEMKEQLSIGPYYLTSITSFKSMRKTLIDGWGISDRLNSVYAITGFLIINIFLGLIGTFWYRTQARRGEIGLRISLGATKQKVKSMMFIETLLLLFVASVIGVNICINIAQTDLLSAIDIPKADRVMAGTGIEQDFINFGLTFLFLAIVSLIAVWYPAKQSSDIPPAEALREE